LAHPKKKEKEGESTGTKKIDQGDEIHTLTKKKEKRGIKEGGKTAGKKRKSAPRKARLFCGRIRTSGAKSGNG